MLINSMNIPFILLVIVHYISQMELYLLVQKAITLNIHILKPFLKYLPLVNHNKCVNVKTNI